MADDESHGHWQLASHAISVPLLEHKSRYNCTAREVKLLRGRLSTDGGEKKWLGILYATEISAILAYFCPNLVAMAMTLN